MQRYRKLVAIAMALAMLATAGCAPRMEFGTVSGRVTWKGKPADKIRVEFHPDSAQGAAGPSSSAVTDADGRYVLEHAGDNGAVRGAVVGPHKVVLNDLRMAESETGYGLPLRVDADTRSVTTTPLTRTVAAGDQTIDIELGGAVNR